MKIIVSMLLWIPFIAAAADFHHVHMRAKDTLRAATWYAENMQGEQLQVANFHGVRFGRTLLLFAPQDRQGADGSEAPGVELKSSAGSALDHLGFSFTDLQAQLPKLQLAGARVIKPPENVQGLFSYAFIEDPWGQKIEVMQDPDLIGFHHVHVVSLDPYKEVRWYQNMFGGEITTFKNFAPLLSIRYGDFWLIASATETKPVPSMFTMLDHLGWRMVDVDVEMARMAQAKAKILQPAQGFYWWQAVFTFMPGPKNGFIESPDGVTIEVMQTN